ncbi:MULTISPECIES: 3'-5' exonuclease [unclassified Caulobacter]|uniref:3'-5' exonuclease n=1 Tax=unclassified Caulobacter TaxID=2648921 RepID=UPI000D35F274|nr:MULTISPECIES: ribonuclease H-like domain-containing protein [unclassified Caulobacter]PTS81676.1 3'-5' exonuclease [Caulobacter sp. HMWF009]PTT04983.1 3'-5' exonuclease [Caulobacter sp. HMWF025]
MAQYVVVFDLETIPDLEAVSRINGLAEHDDAVAEGIVGEKFPKLPLHKIACIGAVIAERLDDHWAIRSLGAPHMGERSEADLISSFSDRLQSLRPTLVSFNGQGFDLPVLRYRAMVNSIPAPGLHARAYFKRYDDAAVDLCDVLGSYSSGAKAKLDELCRVLGLAGKPDGVDGAEVAGFVKAGRIAEVAAYCETDVVNTYRVWLRYELFRGALKPDEFRSSETALADFIRARLVEKPHLAFLIDDLHRSVEVPISA